MHYSPANVAIWQFTWSQVMNQHKCPSLYLKIRSNTVENALISTLSHYSILLPYNWFTIAYALCTFELEQNLGRAAVAKLHGLSEYYRWSNIYHRYQQLITHIC